MYDMGGKGGATASSISPSPRSASAAAVCCMCGDHGLTQELFRCKVCHFRSQHKYCSDLYPKEEHYRVCNWCIREEGGRSSARESATANNIGSTSSEPASGGASGGGLQLGGVMLHRGSFSSLVDKPIKKQRVPKRSTSDATEEMRSAAALSPVALGRKRQAFRGKARRYKLLEEVSS
ncbi:uncharacterized protein M6B38_145925 [Iris pallida]|uniref:PHD-type zinc finger plants domain-containing protein n=1 Tax=Iris pallida TaxID=29817 RepID=A0AAX6F8Q8_IRIPA|nr:uncharacterized protein M6B38_145925 [Iris pallida]